MTQKVVSNFTPRPWQMEVYTNLSRFNTLVVHRRAGKTIFAVNMLIKWAAEKRGLYGYIASSMSDSIDLAWEPLIEYSEGLIANVNVARREIILVNGSKIKLYSYHKEEKLLGRGFSGVIVDETQKMPARVWEEILLPTFLGTEGKVIFIGTPRGENFFYQLYCKGQDENKDNWFSQVYTVEDTGFVNLEEYKDLTQDQHPAKNQQEFWCSFSAAVIGAYYADTIESLEKDGQIKDLEWDPNLLVYTSWDLGINDPTCVWFWQEDGEGNRYYIEYYQESDQNLGNHIQYVQSRPYRYGTHFAPHDINVRDLTSGISRISWAEKEHGFIFEPVKRVVVNEAIPIVQRYMQDCYFDRTKCALGLRALKNYSQKFNETTNQYLDEPNHDQWSHGADAFRYGAIGKMDEGGQVFTQGVKGLY